MQKIGEVVQHTFVFFNILEKTRACLRLANGIHIKPLPLCFLKKKKEALNKN